MAEWEQNHRDRKAKRKRKVLGLPSDDDPVNQINNNHHHDQGFRSIENDSKRRQEALERYGAFRFRSID